MISLKVVLKYLIYIFLAAWMFLLGIVVGRGTSPVKFDTERFQQRLEFLARSQDEQKVQEAEKVDLSFFGALEHPIPTEGSKRADEAEEIVPMKDGSVTETRSPDKIPMKLSRKTLTDRRHLLKKSKKGSSESKGEKKNKGNTKSQKISAQKNDSGSRQSDTPKGSSGKYTIQIAAYKDFKDAVTQMAQLEKKGFKSYREKTSINGETWYRVRAGSFSTLDEAKAFVKKLEKARIKGLIIKKG